MKMKRLLFIAGAILFMDALVSAADEGIVRHSEDVLTGKQLIRAVMDSPLGYIERDDNGPAAEQIRAALKQPGLRVVLRARVVGAFSNPDCKRIEFIYSTPDYLVLKKNSAEEKEPFATGVTLNICRNGNPPMERNFVPLN